MILKLTKGYQTIVDDDLPIEISKRKFQAFIGIRNSTPYATTTINKRTYFLHRLIMNPPKGMVVDHINGDTLDNRRENLRVCTQFENMSNRKTNTNNKFGFKGVNYHKQSGKYRARISVANRRISLGLYSTPEDAFEAYKNASKIYHKEFSNI